MDAISQTTFSSFLNENVWIAIDISLRIVPKASIKNIPALVQIMAWCRPWPPFWQTSSNAFSWMNSFVYWLKFHWSLMWWKVQTIISLRVRSIPCVQKLRFRRFKGFIDRLQTTGPYKRISTYGTISPTWRTYSHNKGCLHFVRLSIILCMGNIRKPTHSFHHSRHYTDPKHSED